MNGKNRDHREPDSAAGDTTHFGFEEVPRAEKERRVGAVFHSVASRYDLMNDLLSLGSHRLIKRFAVQLLAVRRGQRVLDLAGGTGDITARLAPLVGDEGSVTLADINESMLREGRDRLLDAGWGRNIHIVQLNAESLPFAPATFDRVVMAFGLRNVTDKARALAAVTAVLRPGGRLLILEFSTPDNALAEGAYKAWARCWPGLGRLVTGDGDSYRYLVESISMHPDQEALLAMMTEAGLGQCRYHNVLGGVCAVHVGFKGE